MESLYVMAAAVFTIFIIIWKYDNNRSANATLDLALLILVFVVFSGSTELLILGTMISAMTSFILLFYTPKMLGSLDGK